MVATSRNSSAAPARPSAAATTRRHQRRDPFPAAETPVEALPTPALAAAVAVDPTAAVAADTGNRIANKNAKGWGAILSPFLLTHTSAHRWQLKADR